MWLYIALQRALYNITSPFKKALYSLFKPFKKAPSGCPSWRSWWSIPEHFWNRLGCRERIRPVRPDRLGWWRLDQPEFLTFPCIATG